MRPITYSWVWLGSICVSCGVFAFLFTMGSSFPPDVFRNSSAVPSSEVAIVGSSLARAAFPHEPNQKDLAWNRSTRRLSVGGMNDLQLKSVTELAIDGGAEILFIDAGPISRFAAEKRPGVAIALASNSLYARQGLRQLLGPPIAVREHEELTKEYPMLDVINSKSVVEDLNIVHGLRSTFELERSGQWLVEKSSEGVQIILIGFPRSISTTAEYQAAQSEFRSAEISLARFSGVQYFAPEMFWDDSFFADGYHMNSLGRDRYMAELKVWWSEQ